MRVSLARARSFLRPFISWRLLRSFWPASKLSCEVTRERHVKGDAREGSGGGGGGGKKNCNRHKVFGFARRSQFTSYKYVYP